MLGHCVGRLFNVLLDAIMGSWNTPSCVSCFLFLKSVCMMHARVHVWGCAKMWLVNSDVGRLQLFLVISPRLRLTKPWKIMSKIMDAMAALCIFKWMEVGAKLFQKQAHISHPRLTHAC